MKVYEKMPAEAVVKQDLDNQKRLASPSGPPSLRQDVIQGRSCHLSLGSAKFRAVIFDMDGLSIDTEPGFILAWRQAAAAFGVQLDDRFVGSLSGLKSEDIEAALQKAIGGGYNAERFRKLARNHWLNHMESAGLQPMPGLLDLLELLERKGICYALATNSDEANTVQCLRRSGLENRFPVVVTRDQVPLGKPEPDLFVLAASLLGVPASECLVMEDSAISLLAASRAGAIAVLVKTQPPEASLRLAAMAYRTLVEVAESISHFA